MTDGELATAERNIWTKARKYALVAKVVTWVSSQPYYPPNQRGPQTYLVPPAGVPYPLSSPWTYTSFIDGEREAAPPPQQTAALRTRSEPPPAAVAGGGVSPEAGTAIPDWQRGAHALRRAHEAAAPARVSREEGPPSAPARQYVPATEAQELNRRAVERSTQESVQKSTPHAWNAYRGRLVEAQDWGAWTGPSMQNFPEISAQQQSSKSHQI